MRPLTTETDGGRSSVTASNQEHRSRLTPAIGVAAVVVFLLFAGNFLYFFVDDEGIPFVYANSVLHGRGLTYDPTLRPTEGYSDFLSVWIDLGILAASSTAGLPRISVFFAGKLLSLCWGALIVWLVFAVLRRWGDVGMPAAIAGLSVVALGGPLAVWSCSSLETAFFALAVFVLAWALWASPEGDAWLALAASMTVLLARIDGFVYVGALVGPFLLLAPSERRRQVWYRVVLPCAALFIVYQAWRVWYFGDWLSDPMASKVMYKLLHRENVITKPPATGYGLRFLASYGWVPPLAIVAAVAAGCWRDRRAMGLLMAGAGMAGYASIVGDWMFGFRFFVAVLPFLALLTALAVTALARRTPVWVPRVATILLVASFAVSGWRFIGTYERAEHQQRWYAAPSLDPGRYFQRYFTLVEYLQPRVPPGTLIAFNQAGFVPFMLDADNIDNLGICSRFIAELPTTDVFFTEVGRYSPLTNKPVFRASDAYLLYREPIYLIEPADLLRAANSAVEPDLVLDGRYRRVWEDRAHLNAVYERTTASARAFKSKRSFLENVVHVSYLQRAQLGAREVPPAGYRDAFPFLYDRIGYLQVTGSQHVALTFAHENLPVRQLYADELKADHPMAITFQLWSTEGALRFTRRLVMDSVQAVRLNEPLPEGLRAATLTIDLNTLDSAPQAVLRLRDVRLQGQTPQLAAYLDRALPEAR